MTQPDPVLARLSDGIRLRQQGHHAEARVVMEQLWNDIGGADGGPLHRCTITHSLADAQDEVDDELHWDLAECYRKLGRHAHAREHLQLGSRGVDDLPAGEYGDTIRGALADLEQRLAPG